MRRLFFYPDSHENFAHADFVPEHPGAHHDLSAQTGWEITRACSPLNEAGTLLFTEAELEAFSQLAREIGERLGI